MPIVSVVDDRPVLDVEGMVSNADGTFWIRDEYGPCIYRFTGGGHLSQTVQLPNAVLPQDATGALNFTSFTQPAIGRSDNHGI